MSSVRLRRLCCYKAAERVYVWYIFFVTLFNGLFSCYIYPPDVKDPCHDIACSFGAQCVPSLDGLTARCQCPERCDDYGDSKDSKPVCGSDGVEYPNDCTLRKAACQQMKEIRSNTEGRCSEF